MRQDQDKDSKREAVLKVFEAASRDSDFIS